MDGRAENTTKSTPNTISFKGVEMNKDNRGGKREGAGRKPSGKKKRNYYVTDQEHEEIKKLIVKMREGK